MNQDMIDLLKDPKTGGPVTLDKAVCENGRIKTAYLLSDGCTTEVKDFIPRFVDSETYAASFGYEWTHFRRTQLDSHTGTSISRNRWIDITGKQPEDTQGKIVMEAGCGSGRFLEVVAPYARKAIGLDMSLAVEAARDNLMPRFGSVDLVQADLNDVPLRNGSVDFLYSIGVLHHIPDTFNGIKSLLRCVKPGGEVAVWLYGPKARWPLPLPGDIYRHFGSRVHPDRLLRFLRHYVPFALRTRHIPLLGKVMKLLLPAPEYPQIPIPDQMRLEWSVLDAFDRFATRIEKHFTEDELWSMLTSAGLVNIRRGRVYNSFVATKPQ